MFKDANINSEYLVLLCLHLQTFKPTDAQNSKSEEQDKSFPQVPGHDVISCLLGTSKFLEHSRRASVVVVVLLLVVVVCVCGMHA